MNKFKEGDKVKMVKYFDDEIGEVDMDSMPETNAEWIRTEKVFTITDIDDDNGFYPIQVGGTSETFNEQELDFAKIKWRDEL